MKTLLITLALLSSVVAEDEPRKLTATREQYQAAIENVNIQYVTALKKVLVEVTKTGDLKAALKVQKEIEAYETKAEKKSTEQRLIFNNTTWKVLGRDENLITFKGDRVFYKDSKNAVTGVYKHSLGDDSLTVKWDESGRVLVFKNVTKAIADSGKIISIVKAKGKRRKGSVTWIKK